MPRAFGLAIAGFILISQFQNCAPVDPNLTYDMPGNENEVRIIDRWDANEALSIFVQGLTVLPDVASLTVTGQCTSDEGSDQAEWAVIGPQGLMFNGVAACVQGGLSITLNEIAELSCGTDYDLVVDFAGESQAVNLNRLCATNSN